MYRNHSKKSLRQGDIAICEFHQLRARSGEPSGPAGPELANEDLPYLGPKQDIPVQFALPSGEIVERRLRIWFGPVMVLHQNCEIEYADAQDSRLAVAPIVSEAQWPNGPWELIEKGELPGYFYLEPLDEDRAKQFDLSGAWPRCAVVLASSTCLSRGIVKPNRKMTLELEALSKLQEAMVRFGTVRGWGSVDALARLAGMTIVSVSETAETVPGPARLAKVILRGGDNPDDDDEITVAWGVRRSAGSIAAD